MIPRRKAHAEQDEYSDIAELIRTTDANDTESVAKWEKCVADYVDMPYAAAISSGRRAMALIFKQLNIGLGDEVIIPAYTLKDLVPLIQECGATVIPADIDPETLNVTPQAISDRITPRSKAILALHAFGFPCAIEDIVAVGAQHGVPVIEDCAHSLGATVENRHTGSFGYAGFFSFDITKPVNTYGGGIVVSRDAELIESIHKETAGDVPDIQPLRKKIRAIRMERVLFSTGLGFPMLYLLASPRWKQCISRLYRRFQHAPPARIRYSAVQAKLGLKKIETIGERIKFRNSKAELLRSLLKPEIRTQRLSDGCTTTWFFFVALLPCQASPVRKKLLLRGIDAGVEYEVVDDCAALLGYSDCPNVNDVYSRAIALPMYEGISDKVIRRIARALNALV